MEKHLKFGGSLFSDKAMLVMLYPLHFIGKIMIPCRFQAVVPPFLVRHTALPTNPRWRSAMQIFFRCLQLFPYLRMRISQDPLGPFVRPVVRCFSDKNLFFCWGAPQAFHPTKQLFDVRTTHFSGHLERCVFWNSWVRSLVFASCDSTGILNDIPSGNLTQLLKMAICSGFTH